MNSLHSRDTDISESALIVTKAFSGIHATTHALYIAVQLKE